MIRNRASRVHGGPVLDFNCTSQDRPPLCAKCGIALAYQTIPVRSSSRKSNFIRRWPNFDVGCIVWNRTLAKMDIFDEIYYEAQESGMLPSQRDSVTCSVNPARKRRVCTNALAELSGFSKSALPPSGRIAASAPSPAVFRDTTPPQHTDVQFLSHNLRLDMGPVNQASAHLFESSVESQIF
jgi:hypothetical protein